MIVAPKKAQLLLSDLVRKS